MHIQPWIRDTFKDLQEDLDEANAEGKRLAIMFEQRGCIYCKKMHETVYTDPELAGYIDDNFFVVRLNLHGDLEVVDFDGDTLSEKKTSRKWGILFTPSIIFMPESVEDGQSAIQASVAMMPGAFSRGMTLDMFTWVNEKRLCSLILMKIFSVITRAALTNAELRKNRSHTIKIQKCEFVVA